MIIMRMRWLMYLASLSAFSAAREPGEKKFEILSSAILTKRVGGGRPRMHIPERLVSSKIKNVISGGGLSSDHLSTSQLLKVTLPLLVIWLSNPVMSLIDTSVVGKRSLPQLAALAPATSICDTISYVYTFLASVTTALVALANVEGDLKGVVSSTCTGAFIALIIGTVTTFSLFAYGRKVLMLFLGNSPGVEDVLPHALLYTRVRSLGFPAVTITMALQGACLAQKDIRTPLRACAVSASTNLVLDLLFVFGFGWGIAGAAAATMMAQYLGALILLITALRKMKGLQELPNFGQIKAFMGLGGPVSLAIICQCATTFFVSVAASSCCTVSLAAHQVTYGIFLLFCPIGEAISQTVQAFLPSLLDRGAQPEGSILLIKPQATPLIMTLVRVAGILGVLDGCFAWVIPALVPGFFSKSTAVWTSMRSVAKYSAGSLALHATSMLFQGVMLAQRDVKSLALMYGVFSIGFSTLFLLLRRKENHTLSQVWQLFLVYHISRCVLFSTRVLWCNRHILKDLRKKNEENNMKAA